ncbi:MAG: family 10 glycosylhydrolase [Bacteroidaceae bacterium]|nr:family 10 glycosylhydrolase [Bacteroidaceae bacterium]
MLFMPLNVCAQLLQEGPAPKREMRAVWLTVLNGLDWPKTRATSEATRERQKAELCQILDQLKAANFNTVLLQTRVRGSVIYPSDLEPWDGALTGAIGTSPGYDPLQFAIEETHRRGMELHAWVVTIPCFKVAVAKQMKKKGLLKSHPSLCRKHGDTYYLDPGIPETADYLVRICHEMVERYDVDGIHFDYIRYPEGAASFNDAATFRKLAPKGANKAAWRRENITRIVRRIYEDVHALKPWVRVSSSPVGKHADLSRFSSRGWNARDAVHQEAQRWLREGIHDILFPMMYFDGNHFYPFAADWQEQAAGRLVAPGLGIYLLHPQEKNWPLSAVQRQLHFLRAEGLAGQCYFRSKFVTDNVKGCYDYLQRDFYAFPALPPACTWLDDVPPSPPSLCAGQRLDEFGDTLRWLAANDNQPGGVRYNLYASQEWPVDVTRAEHLVASLLPEPLFKFNPLYATLSRLNFAVTAIDRCGNESEALQLTAAPPSIFVPQKRLHKAPSGQLEFY